MNKSLGIALSVLFAFCAPICVSAQNGQTLFSEIERVSQKTQPEWKIQRKLVSQRYISIWWKSDNAILRASIEILSSEKEATDTFDAFDSEISEGREVSVRSGYAKTELLNLGDKNYLWSHRKGGASILFRKGNVFVLCIAPSAQVAIKFAQLIAEQIP